MSSLELQTIELAPTKAPYSDMVLSYKYTALHPRMISTALGFPAAPTRPTPLPRGYCEFSFAMQEAKMKDTFGNLEPGQGFDEGGRSETGQRRHRPLRLALPAPGQGQEKPGQPGDYCTVLYWREDASRVPGSRHLGDNPELGDLMVAARGEVERWKEEQRADFRMSLAELEAGHLQLLGQEWREREVEREKCPQDNMERVRQLEEELKVEIAQMKKGKLEVEAEG